MTTRNWRVGLVVMGYAVAACGGGDDDGSEMGPNTSPSTTVPAGAATSPTPPVNVPQATDMMPTTPPGPGVEASEPQPSAPEPGSEAPGEPGGEPSLPGVPGQPVPVEPADGETPQAPADMPVEMPAVDDPAPDNPTPDEGEMTGETPMTVDGGAFTIDSQLASDVDSAAPTTVGIVTWSTTLADVTEARIEFGLDDTYGMVAPVDLAEPDLRTLLLGMKPEREYHYRVVAATPQGQVASEDQVIQTGAATNAVSIGSFNVIDEEAREPGFIVGSYWQGDGQSVGFILDADGEIVWWHDFGAGGIARMRMSATGKNMWMIVASNSGGALQRVGLDGLGGETYANTTGSHDLTAVSGEVMAYLDYGESDCDSIFEIDPDGMPIEIWDSEEEFGGGGGGGGFGGGGCHSNALRYSAAEELYTFSDVGQGFAFVSRSGELQWRLSDVVEGGVNAWGGRNHGHHLLDDSIVIYANDGGQNASAAIEYSLADGQEILFYDSGDTSANLGDVQRLPGGNTLVTHSNASIVHEIDSEGRLVMEFDGAGSRIGYTLWRASLYGEPPDLGL